MIGDKIKERRNELNLKQSELSAMTGIKTTTISNYENNVSTPNEQNLYKLMEALKCDANFLFEWEETEKLKPTYTERQHIKKYRSLDGYGKKAVDDLLNTEYDRCINTTKKDKIIHLPKSVLKVSAGTGTWLDEQQLESVSVIDTPESRKASLIIEVEGDSMNPMYHDGDSVFVNTQQKVEIGDIGIFILDGNGYIKKLAKDRLISLNPDYDDIYPQEFSDFRCVGKVLGKAEIVD